jgi:hypothetical protein
MNRSLRKKGVFLDLSADTLGWWILFIGVIFWMTVFLLTKTNVTYDIKEKSVYISDDDVLLTYLQTPVGNKNIADLAAEAYFGGNNQILKKEMNNILNSVYGKVKPVCWKLWAYSKGAENEKELASEECKGEKAEILDVRTTIPLQSKEVIELRLIVPGYKE